jgi:hypothetical protein
MVVCMAVKIKIVGEPSLALIGLWFDVYLWPPSEKYKILS